MGGGHGGQERAGGEGDDGGEGGQPPAGVMSGSFVEGEVDPRGVGGLLGYWAAVPIPRGPGESI
ncbi:hypothetical protein [Amycolatopsis sp. NPDC059021]|uniref:hypothetical protein n=1 Tax=Amycolatopsis sp. NPDC059021 TaxID=3346704 RepID=UPI003670C5E2